MPAYPCRAAIAVLVAVVLASSTSPLAAANAVEHGTAARPQRAAATHPHAAEIAEAARRFGIAEDWIAAVIAVESAGDPNAVSSAGAMGLMQLMPATYAELRRRYRLGADPFEPRDNVLAGTAYLRELLDRFGVAGAFAAYNAGPTRYGDYLAGRRSLPAETVAYLAKLAARLPELTALRTAFPAQDRVEDWRDSALFVPRGDDPAGAASEHDPRPERRPSDALFPVRRTR